MRLQTREFSIDGERIACDYALKDKNVVIFHGAGQSSRMRFRALAEEALRRGVGVVLFDFSSHGDSTGQRAELSLQRRKLQAQQIISTLVPEGPLFLVGFSMGAQTVCDVLPYCGDRVEAILLGCPAVYAAQVYAVPFGQKAFTANIRETESWKQTDAFAVLRQFSGRTVIAIGDKDDIIPRGVVDELRQASGATYREYAGVTHQLAVWLAENPTALRDLMYELLR